MTRSVNSRYPQGRFLAIGSASLLAVTLSAGSAAAHGDLWSINGGRMYIQGGGYGHGKGMSQWGAQGAALRNVGYRDILKFYYPGTTMGSTAAVFNRPIRVRLDTHPIGTWFRIAGTPGATVTMTDTGSGKQVTLTDAPYFRMWRNASGKWDVQVTDAVSSARTVHTVSGRAKFSATGGNLVVVFANGVKTEYRGDIVAEPEGSKIAPVNHLPMDDYLLSVVPAEVITSWQPDALRAQAVAARTYAVYQAARKSSSSAYDVCSTVMCQMYSGVPKEHPSTSAAVRDTAGQVLLYGGKAALTMFSASNGGQSVKYTSYTSSRKDAWDAGAHNKVHNWSKWVEPNTFKKKWPAIGDPLYVQVRERDGNGRFGGRITKAEIFGTKGSVKVTGPQLRFGLGLRSELAYTNLSGILASWQDMGGASGYLGPMTSGEYQINNGRMQDFRNGRVMWSPEGGSHALFGAIGGAYFASNGPKHWGPAMTGEFGVPGGQQQNFKYGAALWSPKHGAHMLFGGICHHFLSHGGAKTFGLPLSGEKDAPGGRMQSFTRGDLIWSSATDTVTWHPK